MESERALVLRIQNLGALLTSSNAACCYHCYCWGSTYLRHFDRDAGARGTRWNPVNFTNALPKRETQLIEGITSASRIDAPRGTTYPRARALYSNLGNDTSSTATSILRRLATRKSRRIDQSSIARPKTGLELLECERDHERTLVASLVIDPVSSRETAPMHLSSHLSRYGWSRRQAASRSCDCGKGATQQPGTSQTTWVQCRCLCVFPDEHTPGLLRV